MLKSIDQKITELKAYLPERTKQPDHDEFWEQTITETRSKPLNARLAKIDYPINEINAYQISYHGFDETPIQGYYITPTTDQEKFPCLIFFHGYGGGKHSVSDYMKWLIQGYAVIAIDCRGQGRSGDYSHYSSDEMGSWVTKGILDKDEYYYRKVYMDGIRAIDFACNQPEIDQSRIGIMGGSMGGGITLAVAALDKRPALAIADVPNMCHLAQAIHEKSAGSLTIVENFLDKHPEYTEQVFTTLSYFDNLNLVEQIDCRVRVSVGLKDPICTPKSIFGVYNHIQAPKSIEVYPFAKHNVSNVEHVDKTIKYMNDFLFRFT